MYLFTSFCTIVTEFLINFLSSISIHPLLINLACSAIASSFLCSTIAHRSLLSVSTLLSNSSFVCSSSLRSGNSSENLLKDSIKSWTLVTLASYLYRYSMNRVYMSFKPSSIKSPYLLITLKTVRHSL